MVKPGKKKDKSQSDNRQTKISSFFANPPNKNEESKLFTNISTSSLRGAGRLTLTKSRNAERDKSANSASEVCMAYQKRCQGIRKKQTVGINSASYNDGDDVVVIDDGESCTAMKLISNTDEVALHEDDESNVGGLLTNNARDFNSGEGSKNGANSKKRGNKQGTEDNSDHPVVESMLCTLNSEEYAQSKDPDKSCSASNKVNPSSCSGKSQKGEYTANEFCETSESAIVTPTKQGIKNNLCDSLEYSPDIIYETPNVDRVFKDAALRRRRATSSRSFLCASGLLGVQPGLKPAHLRMNQQKGARKIGKISVIFTPKSDSVSNSSEDKKTEESSASEINAVEVSAGNHARNNDSASRDNISLDTFVNSHVKKQISSSHVMPFQEKHHKRSEPVSDDKHDAVEGSEILQNDVFCIPETQYLDVVNDFKAIDNVAEDTEIDYSISNDKKELHTLKKIHPFSKHNEKPCPSRCKYEIEQYISGMEDTSIDDPAFKPFRKSKSESIISSSVQKLSSYDTTTVNDFENEANNVFVSKASHRQIINPCSDSPKSHYIEIRKPASKLINALEEADSKARITEENLWLEERLMKHFREDDIHLGYTGNVEKPMQQEPDTTPVKMYGESKCMIKRQAKSGLSPCSKRQSKNLFTDLKDKMPTHDFPSYKELNMLAYPLDKAKKPLCLEKLASTTTEIQQNKTRLTEQRACQFGLKKKGIIGNENKKVTLENDKLLSELLGQLKSPSKADSKSTAHALKELNPAPGTVVERETDTMNKYSNKNVAFSKSMLAQKISTKNNVLQSDIEMLDQLFGNDTSDSEEMVEDEKQTKVIDQEYSVLQRDVLKNCDADHTFVNNSTKDEPIIILDDTQNMDVENNECIIIEDNSDICHDSTCSSKSHESQKIPEDKGDLGLYVEICSKEADNTGSHNTALESLNCCSLSQDVSVTCTSGLECSRNITVSELVPAHGAYSSSRVLTCDGTHQSITTSTTYPQRKSNSVTIENNNSCENGADNNKQTSIISTNSFVPNTDVGKFDWLKHKNKELLTVTDSSESSVVLGETSENYVSAKNSLNIKCENSHTNCAEESTAVTTIRQCTSTECDKNVCSSSVVAGSGEYTELSTSVCEMLCESFDEDFDDFKKSEMANRDFKFTDLWNRFTVQDIYRTRDEIDLKLVCDKTCKISHCILRGFWADTVIGKEDVVNIVGSFSNDVCIIDDRNGLIVVNPDLLLSGTLVVSSTFCARKSVLNEKFKGVDSGNIQMFYGSVIHSLFQSVLKDSIRNERAILQVAKLLLKSHKFLHEMYSHDVQEVSVMEEIGQYIPSLTSWLTKHTQAVCLGGKARLQESNVMVTKIHDIEENIWSPRFGVKGKIDVTVKAMLRKPNSNVELKVVPLELKTGKASFSPEHRGQVTLYSMMCSDRREDPEEGILLYLKHGEMEIVPVKPQNKSGLIQLRNNLAHYLTQEVGQEISADGHVTYHLGQLPKPINNQRACRTCAHLLNCSIYQRMVERADHPEKHAMNTLVPEALQHLTEADLSYFTSWMLCLDMEGQESQKKHLSQIWRTSSSEREKNGECLSNLVIASSELDIPESQCFNEGRGCSLTFTRHPSYLGSPLTAVGLVINDMVVISSEDGHYIALATGFVRRMSHDLVEVVVDRDYLHDTSAFANMRFRLDKNDSFSTSGYLYTNLSTLMESTPRAAHLRDLVIKLRPPEFDLKLSKACIQKVKAVFKPLNKQQRTAILKVLMSKDYILIKGFPGTGKTATIVALVKILRLIGQSVLLTSYTHSAVDNILLKLKEDGIPFLRLGQRARIHPSILSHSAEVLTSSAVNSVQELKNFYDSHDVVATSALGVNHPVFKQRKFDVCIVDEASQVLQPVCLGPLFHCHRFVLVGDPKQLPPVVQSKEARNLGMDKSLFARLDNTGATYDLCLQYRMNRVIMELSNSLVYDGKLQCASPAVAEQCCRLNQSQILDTPSWMKDILNSDLERSVMFLDTQKTVSVEKSDGKGIVNDTEADLVVSILKAVVKASVAAHDVGVISPYRSQVKLIKQKIHGCSDVMNVEVNTVDQYQGRDKSVIIVSFVRSQSDNSGELLKDLRRLNVALTRARHKLILIGNAKSLEKYEHIAKILMWLKETKNIVQITEL